MSTTSDGTAVLGPGEFKIILPGGTSQLNISCMVNNARIVPDVSEGDSKTMLCGKEKKAADTTTWTISGSVDTDFGYGDGFAAATWQYAGETVEFEFTPSTSQGTTAVGELRLHPLEFGADDYGDWQDSDFEFALVDFDPKTALSFGELTGSPVLTGVVAITGVTAGTPGSFTPDGATLPANIAALRVNSIVGDDSYTSAAWTEGQYVLLGDGSSAYWTGSEWAVGTAPAAASGE